MTKAEPQVPKDTKLHMEPEEGTTDFLVFYYAEDGNMVPVTTTSLIAARELVMGHNRTID